MFAFLELIMDSTVSPVRLQFADGVSGAALPREVSAASYRCGLMRRRTYFLAIGDEPVGCPPLGPFASGHSTESLELR